MCVNYVEPQRCCRNGSNSKGERLENADVLLVGGAARGVTVGVGQVNSNYDDNLAGSMIVRVISRRNGSPKPRSEDWGGGYLKRNGKGVRSIIIRRDYDRTQRMPPGQASQGARKGLRTARGHRIIHLTVWGPLRGTWEGIPGGKLFARETVKQR